MFDEPRTIQVNDAELSVQTFGDAADPPVLLIMGAAASMDWWPDEFCTQLAGTGLHVVRYDLRDTGQSTHYEPSSPAYTMADLVADAVGILDTLGVERAHVVGMSMGGGIAQHLAASQADRVATLTLIATSFAGSPDVELPPMSSELEKLFSEPSGEPDWSDRAAVVDSTVAGIVPFLGSVRTDDAALRDLVGRVFDRTHDMAATNTNHWILEGGGLEAPDTSSFTMPVLVMHGTEDPLFPYPHGQAQAAAIPGARLVPLDGVGHGELPPESWGVAVDAIADLTRR